MTKPMTDKRLSVVLGALRAGTSQLSLVDEVGAEIRRLREENGALENQLAEEQYQWRVQHKELDRARELLGHVYEVESRLRFGDIRAFLDGGDK